MESPEVASSSSRPNAILRLDPEVVNRIAAGEIIQRPANAIKEMMENSIDANSSNIQIIVKEGGLKLIQIQDNGTGIQKVDLNLVCERFATSKLRKFEDLQTINTYGFRGEALSSISHIAHVSIKTKTADSPCAYQVNYCDGLPKGSPKPCAGNQGTLILVEDLYYNVPVRRRAFQNHSNEYSRIVEVVSRYAVHNASVGFSVKKHGETVSDIKTSQNSTTLENIKILFGVDKTKDLLDISLKDETLQFQLDGYISSADYTAKRTTFILFINHRLVESNALRKAIDSVYSSYLPKHQFPFIYMSLQIHPNNVDVNVHPTKEEVHFLNEGPIIEAIQKVIEERLLGCNSSRTLLIQSVLPNMQAFEAMDVEITKNEKDVADNKKVYAYNMVRTDSREQKLDVFYQNLRSETPDTSMKQTVMSAAKATVNRTPIKTPRQSSHTITNMPYRREILLESVLNLRKAVEDCCDKGLLQIFSNYTFVGCVDRHLSLIQNQTKLYLLNVTKLSEEFFYQVMIRDFGNFSKLELSTPALIRELADLALEYNRDSWKDSYGSKENFSDSVVELFISKSAMLKDYFSLEVDKDGHLLSIPCLLDNYCPALEGLPLLMLRLCCEVDWESEQACFESFCKQMALFYRFPEFTPLDFTDLTNKDQEEGISETSEKSWKYTIENVIFPAFRKYFMPSRDNLTNGYILQIANLPDLYKVFERC